MLVHNVVCRCIVYAAIGTIQQCPTQHVGKLLTALQREVTAFAGSRRFGRGNVHLRTHSYIHHISFCVGTAIVVSVAHFQHKWAFYILGAAYIRIKVSPAYLRATPCAGLTQRTALGLIYSAVQIQQRIAAT